MHSLKKFKDLNKYTKLAAITIAIGIIIRFALISMYHVSGDACWHLSISRFLAENLKIPLLEPLGREVFWEPPIFHIIAATFYKIFSVFGLKTADFGMKLVSPVFGSLSLILAFIILDRLFGKKIAFYSSIFMAFLPINIFYSVIAYTESLMVFFVLLSIFLIMKNRYILASIVVGLSVLTKYNAIFSLPLIIYLIYNGNKTQKEFLQKSILFGIITALVFLPWLMRNYIKLGNPMWPFFTSIFGGYTSYETFQGIDIFSIFKLSNLITLYLGIFGVPEGSYQNIFFFDIQFLKIFFGIWLVATIVFIIPVFMYYNAKKTLLKVNAMILIWVIPHLLLIVLYIMNTSIAYSRLLIPVMPIFSVMWGLGISYIMKKLNHKFKIMMIFILLIIIIGFVAGELIKITLASKAWNFYEEDFAWVKKNTDENSVFAAGGQCLSYNLNRLTLNPIMDNIDGADYIWVNQNFKLDRHSILSKQILKSVQSKDYKTVYYNKATGTTVYSTH